MLILTDGSLVVYGRFLAGLVVLGLPSGLHDVTGKSVEKSPWVFLGSADAMVKKTLHTGHHAAGYNHGACLKMGGYQKKTLWRMMINHGILR